MWIYFSLFVFALGLVEEIGDKKAAKMEGLELALYRVVYVLFTALVSVAVGFIVDFLLKVPFASISIEQIPNPLVDFWNWIRAGVEVAS